MRYTFFLFSLLLFVGCNLDEGDRKIIAQVGDEKLYADDLAPYFAGVNTENTDSISLLNSLRNEWVKKELLALDAQKKDLPMSQIEFKVAQYKKDLIIYEALKTVINERLDTLVEQSEIKNYYEANKEDFQLKDYLVKVLYVKIPKNIPDQEKLNQLYKLRKPTDIEEIESIVKLRASNFYYDDQNWIYFDDLLKEVPLHDINKDRFIINKSKIRFEENDFLYFLNVFDYKLKNAASPLSFERNKIKQRLLTKRRKELEAEITNEIIQNGEIHEHIEIYD